MEMGRVMKNGIYRIFKYYGASLLVTRTNSGLLGADF